MKHIALFMVLMGCYTGLSAQHALSGRVYDKDTKEPVIKDLQRISKPGLRKYAGSSEIPRILNGLGIAIVSTSKGLMTGKQAKQLNVGGEVICYVY